MFPLESVEIQGQAQGFIAPTFYGGSSYKSLEIKRPSQNKAFISFVRSAVLAVYTYELWQGYLYSFFILKFFSDCF